MKYLQKARQNSTIMLSDLRLFARLLSSFCMTKICTNAYSAYSHHSLMFLEKGACFYHFLSPAVIGCGWAQTLGLGVAWQVSYYYAAIATSRGWV